MCLCGDFETLCSVFFYYQYRDFVLFCILAVIFVIVWVFNVAVSAFLRLFTVNGGIAIYVLCIFKVVLEISFAFAEFMTFRSSMDSYV